MSKELQRLRQIAKALDDRPQAVVAARDAGIVWNDIAEALKISRAQAINIYNAEKERMAGLAQ